MTRSLSRVVSKLTRTARSDRLWPRRAIGASDLHLPVRQPLQLQRGSGETVTVLRTQGRAFYRDVQVERQFGKIVGGVISPVLSNLFLHYAFDVWMHRNHPGIPFERYADDAICHCTSEEQAEALRVSLEKRFAECGLTLHPEKTKIVYCKDDDRRGAYPDQKFDFLGYTFRPR